MKYLLGIFFLLVVKIGICQRNTLTIKQVKPNHINRDLLIEIEKYIDAKELQNNLFKSGFGFVLIRDIKDLSRAPFDIANPDKKETLSFTIGLGSYYITPNLLYADSYCENCYPTYYTVVKNHIVLIYSEITGWLFKNRYSIKSQKKLEKKLIPYFKQTLDESFDFYDFFEKKIFRLSKDERQKLSNKEIYKKAAFVLNEGKKISFYNDGSVKDYEFPILR